MTVQMHGTIVAEMDTVENRNGSQNRQIKVNNQTLFKGLTSGV